MRLNRWEPTKPNWTRCAHCQRSATALLKRPLTSVETYRDKSVQRQTRPSLFESVHAHGVSLTFPRYLALCNEEKMLEKYQDPAVRTKSVNLASPWPNLLFALMTLRCSGLSLQTKSVLSSQIATTSKLHHSFPP